MGSLAARFAIIASGLAIASATQAATINWSTGPGFGGASGFQSILTSGALVAAVDFNNDGVNRTVDPGGINITFSAVSTGWFFYDSGSPGSTDAAWNEVVDHSAFSNINLLVPSFLQGLTLGRSYQLQLFASDTRGCCSNRISHFGDGAGSFSDPVAQGTFTSIVGQFVADGSSQALELEASSTNPILSAYVLRDVTPVPEPATWTLGLAGTAMMAGLTRRRRR